MILVDSSIWVDHFRAADPDLTALLGANEVLCHPFVIGEVLMGNARHWAELRRMLERRPQVFVARESRCWISWQDTGSSEQASDTSVLICWRRRRLPRMRSSGREIAA